MSVSEPTAKAVWGSSAGRCALCREIVIAETPANNISLIGQIAHIVGKKEKAARGASPMQLDARNEFPNLILLCLPHHKIVDDHPDEYPVERLRQIRSDHLAWIRDNLAKVGRWDCALSTLFYINVPRLGEYALQRGYDIAPPAMAGHQGLNQLGSGLVDVMNRYKRALSSLPIDSFSLAQVGVINADYLGSLVHFQQTRFRTKNIKFVSEGSAQVAFTGDLASDPHIYAVVAGWKFVIPIDRRWITTSTAEVHFRPASGQVDLSGFARINRIDFARRLIFASGLALGLPPSPLEAALRANPPTLGREGQPAPGPRSPPADKRAFFEGLEDKQTKRFGYIHEDPPNKCDFCSKLLADESYMVDGPREPDGLWGNMCGDCYLPSQQPFGVGKGQLYKQIEGTWHLVAGYPLGDDNADADQFDEDEVDFEDEDEDIPPDVAEGFGDWLIAGKWKT